MKRGAKLNGQEERGRRKAAQIWAFVKTIKMQNMPKKVNVKLLLPFKFQRGQPNMYSGRFLVYRSTFAKRLAHSLLNTSLNDDSFGDVLMGSQLWSTLEPLCFLRKKFRGEHNHQSQKHTRECLFQSRSRQDWITSQSEPISLNNHGLNGNHLEWSDPIHLLWTWAKAQHIAEHRQGGATGEEGRWEIVPAQT